MAKLVRVAIYVRCSSVGQAVRDLSIPAQLDAARAYAAREGWVVVEEFVDEAESARTADRPDFQRMIKQAKKKNHPFDVILVWKLSRFARNREDSVLYKAMLKKHGVRLVSLSEPIDDSPTGRMLEGILEVLDEFYSANLAEDTIRGMRKKASSGRFAGGTVATGYVLERDAEGRSTGKLLPCATFAPLVRRVFQESLAGRGAASIARGLNDDGLTTRRGKRWSKNTVLNMLRNETYTGVLIWGQRTTQTKDGEPVAPIRVEGAFEPLVSRAEFERVQAVVASRSSVQAPPARHRGAYLLSGLLKCGHCGSPMIGHPAKGGSYHYYGCQRKMKQGASSCPEAKLLNRDRTERAVVERLRTQVLVPSHLAELARLVNEDLTAHASVAQEEVEAVEAQLAEARRKVGALYEAIESGGIDFKTLAPRLQERQLLVSELVETLEILNERAAAAKPLLLDEARIAAFVEQLRTHLSKGTVSARRAFLHAWVCRITATGYDLEIEYAFPPLLVDDGGEPEDQGAPADDDTEVRQETRSLSSEWEGPRLFTGVLPTAKSGSPCWSTKSLQSRHHALARGSG